MEEIERNQDQDIKELRIKIRKYLELDNVSVLAGAGTSWHLGTPVIRTIPEELKEELLIVINRYFIDKENDSFEDLFNCLQADRYLKQKKEGKDTVILNSIRVMQRWLYENCDVNTSIIPEKNEDVKNHLVLNRFYYHEMLIKKLLQRPTNLKRVNLFTTNYDMAFDYALDDLGVQYINGFSGVHHRFFRPEVYDYDLYYPGQSVSGKVHRAENVVRYYKLHGSLSWESTKPSLDNPYGIQELSLEKKWNESGENDLMIYPCVSKKSFALDLPYSELFRHFAQAITQPQSVLFCLGYSFYDEHINDIIYQALSIPSFTLIIANYSEGENPNIKKLKDLKDPRIIVVEKNDNLKKPLTTFCSFVEDALPNLYEENEKEYIQSTMNKLCFINKDDIIPNREK